MRGVGVYQAAPRSRSRGSASSAALGRLEDGAPAPRERLRRDGVPTPCVGGLEDGAPAPRERLAADGRLLRAWEALRTESPLRVSAYAVNDEPRGALFSTVPY